ncbi:hypothetical protein KUTeg_022485 [Tegillarca granosa]|uniref:Uncharacterized protein n=1 Tax=Tegillarca granosa TaxID=220873 RepID=A0ABQ9E6C1_TEGGR|nr:hypothetical protein KUTeg_022485 [Tegillarca granosa]
MNAYSNNNEFVNGNWGRWSQWTGCTLSCGGGSRKRTRSCDSPSPQYGGLYCGGRNIQVDYCNPEPCPVNVYFVETYQYFMFLVERFQCCFISVHGNWSPWGHWGDCSVSCNSGLQKRFRTCTNPAPSQNGRYCVGPSEDTTSCNTEACPGSAQYKKAKIVSVIRCYNLQKRFRTCTNPAPSQNGRYCVGPSEDTTSCNTEACPGSDIISYFIQIFVSVNGEWEDWSSWSECSKTCDLGNRERSRTCNIALYGGQPCVGDNAQLDECYVGPCSKK